ncbi:MAG: hypothetical protein AAGA56_01120 [Myxococcota bacterium]
MIGGRYMAGGPRNHRRHNGFVWGAVLATAVGCFCLPASAEPPESRVVQPGELPSYPDPLLTVGLSFIPTSAVATSLGLHYGINSDQPERSFGRGLLAAGVSSGVFGVVTTAVGASNTAAGEQTSPFGVAGTWFLGVGVSTLSLGGFAFDAGDTDRAFATSMTTIGAVSVVTGSSFLLTGALVDTSDYRPRSPTQLSFGIALSTVAATLAPAMVYVCSYGSEGEPSELARFDLVFGCLGLITGTMGAAAGGAILWGKGGRRPLTEEEREEEEREDAAHNDDVLGSINLGAGPSGLHLYGTW